MNIISKIPQLKKILIAAIEHYCHMYRLAAKPGSYFSPIPAYEDIFKNRKKLFDIHKAVLGIDLNEQQQLKLFTELAKFDAKDFFSSNNRYKLGNTYYNTMDALMLHKMLRHFEPRRVVEVGCGFSSGVMLDTHEKFLRCQAHFTFIDPYPQRLESLLTSEDLRFSVILKRAVQDVPLSIFESLGNNDFLFIDSSHISKTGGDVNFLLFEIIPRLKQGVVIHFHDIFWPFEYPEEWSLQWTQTGNSWNEIYLIAAFLQYNTVFSIKLFNSYLWQHHKNILSAHNSYYPEGQGSSLWIQKNSDQFK